MRDPRRRLRELLAPAPPKPPVEDTRAVFQAMAELLRRHAEGLDLPPGTRDLTPYEHRVFSQNGEDGVIAELIRRVGSGERCFVEFGIGSGIQGNCVFLADVLGWPGVFMEADAQAFVGLERKYASNDQVRTLHAAVSPANVEDLFARAQVPVEPAIVSIDIDGDDYWVWSAIEHFQPRIVIVEYNAALGTGRRLVQRPHAAKAPYDGTDAFGASLDALTALAHGKGYRLAHTELCGVNAFFVRQDLAGELPPESSVPARACNFDLSGGAPLASERKAERLIDLDRASPPGGPAAGLASEDQRRPRSSADPPRAATPRHHPEGTGRSC